MRRNNPDCDKRQILQDDEMMQSIIFSFMALRDSAQITLMNHDGDIILKPLNVYSGVDRNLFEDEYIRKNKRRLQQGKALLVPSCYTAYRDYSGKPVFLLVRALRDIQSDIVAYISISFSDQVMRTKLMELGGNISEAEIEILDPITHRTIADLENKSSSVSQKDCYQVSCHSDFTGWDIVVRIPNDYLHHNFAEKNWLVIPLILILLLGSTALGGYTYFNIIKPIEQLNKAMKKVEQGDWSVRLESDLVCHDIQTMNHGFNTMVGEIDHLTARILEERMMLKDAQMAALRYQINPHFLYNSLQTIEAIAEVKEIPDIQMISKSMGDILRYNIRGFETVTLREELNMIRAYLQIEKIRFGDALEFQIDVEKQDEECEILKFILQPIVENCIVHGLSSSKNKKIRIFANIYKNSVLLINVYNNGIPIPETRLREIQNCLQASRESNDITWVSKGIGLMNVHKRLINRFGEKFGVAILFSNENGTCIQLSLPKKQGGNHEKDFDC